VTWCSYQAIVAAYRNPDHAAAKTSLAKTITIVSASVPAALAELIT
jgi:transposase